MKAVCFGVNPVSLSFILSSPSESKDFSDWSIFLSREKF
jgi:hypothetical protein